MSKATTGAVLVLLIPLLLAGCGGRDSQVTATEFNPSFDGEPVPDAGWPALELPGSAAFEAIRGSQVLLSSAIQGSFSYQSSPDAVADYEAGTMQLYTSGDGVSWAKYMVSTAMSGEDLRSLIFRLVEPLPERFFVGLSDFERGAWQWHEVSAVAEEMSLYVPADLELFSYDGLALVCIAAPAKERVEIAEITLGYELVAPSPVSLQASQDIHGAFVELTWEDPATTYEGLLYEAVQIIRRLSDESSYTLIASVAPGTTSYLDVSTHPDNVLPSYTDITYRVQTVVAGEAGPPSAPAIGRLGSDSMGLGAKAAPIPDRTILTWELQPAAEYYVIEYKLHSDAEYGPLAIINDPFVTSFEHTKDSPPGKECEADTQYDYKLRAVFEDSEIWSFSNCLRYYLYLYSVSASYAEHPDRVELTWTSHYEDTVGYRIYRDGQDEANAIATVGDVRVYADYVDDAQLHEYWIRVHYDGELGAFRSSPAVGCALNSDWQTHSIISADEYGVYSAAAMADGKPVVAFIDAYNNSVKIARSQVPVPDSESDWLIHTVSPVGNGDVGLLALADRLVLCYFDEVLVYAESDSLTPASDADWQFHTIDDSIEGTRALSVMSFADRTLIGYCDDGRVQLARALTADPADAADWDVHVVDVPVDSADGLTIAEINGVPAVCYRTITPGELYYARAITATPSSAADWARHCLHRLADSGNPQLLEVGGKPAILFNDYNELYISQALTATPEWWTDWSTSIVDPESHSYGCAAAVIDGALLVSYDGARSHDTPDVHKLATALTLEPVGEQDWQIEVISKSSNHGMIGAWLDLNGSPAFTYYYPAANQGLMFAFLPSE